MEPGTSYPQADENEETTILPADSQEECRCKVVTGLPLERNIFLQSFRERMTDSTIRSWKPRLPCSRCWVGDRSFLTSRSLPLFLLPRLSVLISRTLGLGHCVVLNDTSAFSLSVEEGLVPQFPTPSAGAQIRAFIFPFCSSCLWKSARLCLFFASFCLSLKRNPWSSDKSVLSLCSTSYLWHQTDVPLLKDSF
jgi:hypothetical protein